MSKPKTIEIDRRVGIALSVLPSSQQLAVKRLTQSPQFFAEAVATPGRVRQMQSSGQLLYMMRVTPSLRLVYTLVGDTIYVVDIVERATLNHFALRKTEKKSVKPKTRKNIAESFQRHRVSDYGDVKAKTRKNMADSDAKKTSNAPSK